MARGNSAGSQTTKATLGLRELVFSGAVAPGERLPEVELAERLGVSRTPLRLALMTLAHEGLLESLPGGGFVVRAFSRADVTTRSSCAECSKELRHGSPPNGSIRPSCSCRSSRPPAELEQVVRNTGRLTQQIGRYVTLNDAFHDGLVELARSPHLARTLANVKALPFAMPSGAILASHAVLPGSHEILLVAQHQHWQLIESIRERQGTRAEEIAREHARLSRLNLDLVLENREARDRMPGAPLLTEVA